MAERQTNSKPEKQDCETIRRTDRKTANVTEIKNRKTKRETHALREREKTVKQIKNKDRETESEE